jgi:hypothetical protein
MVTTTVVTTVHRPTGPKLLMFFAEREASAVPLDRNMSSHQIQLWLWVSQPVLQSVLAVVLFRRKLNKTFPVFFTFVSTQVLLFGIQFSVYQWSKQVYFDVFWISMALNLIIEFKILHEIFLDVFRPYHALKDLGTALFRWSALIMILVSVVVISVSPGWDNPLIKTLLVGHRCLRVIQCGMVLFLIAFAKPLGLSFKRQSMGIAIGFGALSAAELLTNALYSGSHISQTWMNLANMTAYNVGVLSWLVYACLNTSESRVPELVPQRWDDALMDLRPHTEPESLIPMFEHMVDRAFSNAQDGHA